MSNGNAASEKSDLQEDANDTRSTSRKNSVDNEKSGAPSGDDLTDNLKAEKDCAQIDPLVPSDEYPDGGLRAWLVVFGVSNAPKLFTNFYRAITFRQCATHSLHLDMSMHGVYFKRTMRRHCSRINRRLPCEFSPSMI